MALTTAGVALFGAALNAGMSVIDSLVRAGRMREAREYLKNMDIPDSAKAKYEAVLMEAPEKLIPVMQQDTELAQISEDPRLREAQLGALQQMQDIGAQGGYTTAERGQLEAAMADALTRQRGALEAEQSQMRRRGMAGSGIEAMMGAGRRQAAVTGASQRGFDVAQGGMQRALQAMQAAGGLGGQIRGQDWGQKSQVASAQDVINRANVGARNNSQQFNIQQQQAQAAANQAAINQQRAANAAAEAQTARSTLDRDLALAQTYMG